MTKVVRETVISNADRVVIKVGTRVLTDDQGRLDSRQVATIARAIAALVRSGRQVVLVSSGAVGAGMGELGISKRPTDVARLQAVAAVGQAQLIDAYNRVLCETGVHAGQILLTAADLDHRARYLNVRNTLLSLLQMRVLPIVNENDSVGVEELVATFGDNDRLAALVTNLVQAPLLIILSDVDGLYSGEPGSPEAQRISVVERINAEHRRWVTPHRTGLSKGGMASKLNAAAMVTTAGESAWVASGRDPEILAKIFRAEDVGTLFLAQGKSISPRKRWLGFSAQAKGRLQIDAGAVRAITAQGRSLLAIGICRSTGEFSKGDLVELAAPDGQIVARGLTNYHAADIARICGLQSSEIVNVLGCIPYEEVVHRDNLLVTNSSDLLNLNENSVDHHDHVHEDRSSR